MVIWKKLFGKLRNSLLVGGCICVVRLTFGQTQLIGNGGFESGVLAPWQFTGIGEQLANTPGFSHTGLDYLTMGSVNSANQTIYQSVTFPTNAVAALLSYYWAVISTDTTGVDSLNVWIVSTNDVILAKPDIESNSSVQGTYFHKIFDLSPYLGQQTIYLLFSVNTDATSGSLTTFYIDDVSILAATTADLPANDSFTNSTILSGATVTNQANNAFATKEPGEPNHGNNAGGRSLWYSWTAPADGTVKIDTTGSSFVTLLGAYTGTSVSNLTKVASENGINEASGHAKVRFNVSAGVQYAIAVDGVNGEFGTAVLSINFSPDTTPPKITISSPAAGAKETNTTVQVKGTATDTIGVAFVEYRLENANGTNDYQSATGSNSWSAIVTNLTPGVNTVRVRATDTSGNVSATVTRSFTFVVVSPLSLTTSGSGTVSPNLNSHLLNVGVTYTVTAKPSSSAYLFDGWTGDVVASSPTLKFVMQSNMVLVANFVPNPFIPIAGTYQGLFYDTNSPAPQNSGFFSATLKSSGSFSSKIQFAGKTYSSSGLFTPEGMFSNTVPRSGMSSISVQLQLDLAGDSLTGQISDGNWTAQVLARRPGYSKVNPPPQNGSYTLIFPGADVSAEEPGGEGFATVVIDASGNVTMCGTLADGARFSEKTFLTAQNQWPFFASYNSGAGLIFGWLALSDSPDTDIAGMPTWFKLPQAISKFYPNGFTNQTSVSGSRYQFTSNVRVLDFTNGQVWLANGNLSESFTNQVVLQSNNSVVASNGLSLAITTKSGLFKGSVPSPDTGRPISFNGVILQKQNFGSGFFLGTNQTGRVFFGP